MFQSNYVILISVKTVWDELKLIIGVRYDRAAGPGPLHHPEVEAAQPTGHAQRRGHQVITRSVISNNLE